MTIDLEDFEDRAKHQLQGPCTGMAREVLELVTELRRVSDMVRKEREARNWLATMLGEHYGKEDGSPQKWLDEARRIAGILKEE